jgi:TolB-like protein
VGVIGWVLHSRTPVVEHSQAHDAYSIQPNGRNRLVAFVRFNNLSKNPKDAWLGPAMTEMLSTELGSADEIRIVPSDLVHDASSAVTGPRLPQLGKR